MDPGVWSKLPAELLELSLSFLPLVDLCRFRVVCKRWKNLLCSSDFGKLFVVNTSRNANEQACLVVNRQAKGDPGTVESSWSVLNIRERKWYDLKLNLPSSGFLYDVDGGFVCTTVLGWMGQRQGYPIMSLIVFNPFGGVVKVLPDPPSVYGMQDLGFRKILKLMVDNNSNTFKVLLILTDRRYWDPFPFCIYESSADQWTTAPMPSVEAGETCRLISVIFQGLLYCCPEHGNFQHAGMTLSSFNFLDGSWEDAGVNFPDVSLSYNNLAATDNRLFLTRIFQKGSDVVFEICEIMLADKMLRTVAQTKLAEVFPIGAKEERPRKIGAFGLSKSKLLLHSIIGGEVVMYDLASGEWESLPPNPLDDGFGLDKVNAGGTDYCLPYTPWYDLSEAKSGQTFRT